ncbi:hypothetical protein P872_08985 [Rhodonellum psychrophilum GCM71 = DSM 17998]|uniref:Uncharacterized protein n=1 Tax=Rhodonellum psychrophilum GCM71 = DSM 17998 TaxID=1123057 RepID=U5BYZ0_9BACT|nr:hypothetical protein P872_08985 [Rhodonellum psychrophilum GCM71 = DSM 17998]
MWEGMMLCLVFEVCHLMGNKKSCSKPKEQLSQLLKK